MSRQRFIYPEIFASEDFIALSMGARLLFIGLFATADDYGRGKGSLGVIKSTVFPEDELSRRIVAGWIEEIRRRKMVRFYEVAGSVYYEVSNWTKWQSPKYKAKSNIPAFSHNTRLWPGIGADSAPTPAGTGPGSGLEEKRRGEERREEGRGRVGTGGEGSPRLDSSGPLEADDPPALPDLDPEPDPEPDPIDEGIILDEIELLRPDRTAETDEPRGIGPFRLDYAEGAGKLRAALRDAKETDR